MSAQQSTQIEGIILSRIDNIENKVDKMNEAVIALARNEERVNQLILQVGHFQRRNDILEDKIEEIMKNQNKQGTVFNGVIKFFWIAVVAIVSVAATTIYGIPTL